MSFTGKLLLPLATVPPPFWWACSGDGHGVVPAVKATFDQSQPLPAARPLAPAHAPYCGLAWQIHHVDGVVERARRLFGEMAELGANAVLISNPGYQEHAGSDTFEIDPR
jgi:hypothetical protein